MIISLHINLISLVMMMCSKLVSANYHAYEFRDGVRQCLPYYDCAPGHEILPCVEDYTHDLCLPCQNGFVQPDITSSPTNYAGFESIKCFKPQGECYAHDVNDSRINLSSCGNHHKFCKCEYNKCYYGDPCNCSDRKGSPCGPGKTMNTTGDCIPCPPGTEKEESGCGPCKHVSRLPTLSSQRSVVETVQPRPEVRFVNQGKTTPEKQTSLGTTQTSMGHFHAGYIPSGHVLGEEATNTILFGSVTDDVISGEENQKSTYIGIIVVLIVIVIAFLIVLLWLKHRHKSVSEVQTITDDHVEKGTLLRQPVDDETGEPQTTNNIENGTHQNEAEKESAPDNTLSDEGYSSKQNDLSLPELISKTISENSRNDGPPNSVSNKNDVFINVHCKDGGEQHNDFTRTLVTPDQSWVTPREIPKSGASSITDNLQSCTQPEQLKLHVSSLEYVSEINCSPIVQETEQPSITLFREPHTDLCNKGTGNGDELFSSGLGSSVSEDGLSHSIMEESQGKRLQEYGHLVSASDKNTESIDSGLENYNHSLHGLQKLLPLTENDSLFGSGVTSCLNSDANSLNGTINGINGRFRILKT